MVSRDHLARASHQDAESLGKTLLPSIIRCESLGASSVERWANFLADDLLYWADVQGASSRQLDISDDAVTKYFLDGSKPIPVFSAIANGFKRHRRKYDWVEFTPFGARRYGPKALPREGVIPIYQLQGDYEAPVRGDAAALEYGKPTEGYKRLHAHHLMAVCGSAFATDWSAAVRALSLPLRIFMKPFAAFKSRACHPVLGSGTTNVAGLGKLRDGGISINVPYPAVLPMTSGRHVDILLVMDATEGSDGAQSVKDAIKQGYYKADPKDVEGTEWLNFSKARRVHVFHPSEGFLGPVIIFCLGLTERSTLDVVRSEEELRCDCAKVRSWVSQEVVPALITELKAQPQPMFAPVEMPRYSSVVPISDVFLSSRHSEASSCEWSPTAGSPSLRRAMSNVVVSREMQFPLPSPAKKKVTQPKSALSKDRKVKEKRVHWSDGVPPRPKKIASTPCLVSATHKHEQARARTPSATAPTVPSELNPRVVSTRKTSSPWWQRLGASSGRSNDPPATVPKRATLMASFCVKGKGSVWIPAHRRDTNDVVTVWKRFVADGKAAVSEGMLPHLCGMP